MRPRNVVRLFPVLLIGVLMACGGSTAPAAQAPVEVQMSLSEFKLESSLANFTPGVPYHTINNVEEQMAASTLKFAPS